jgi:D-serine deaminase-like pyridoxal phosphate-dependent protein
MTVVDQLAALPTPALLLDERRMLDNIARMRKRASTSQTIAAKFSELSKEPAGDVQSRYGVARTK